MHYLKQTAAKVRDHLFSDKTIQDMQNNFLFQIILLSSVFPPFTLRSRISYSRLLRRRSSSWFPKT